MIRHNHSAPVRPIRVTILGGSGFVGNALLQHLDRLGVETVSVSSKEVDLSRPEAATKLRRFIREEDALVFVSAVTPDKGKDIGTFMQNLSMAEQVCNFLEESSCSHVIYISSDAVYGDDLNPVREGASPEPSSLHGLMHVAREGMLSHTVQSAGPPLLILRPSLLYGAGDTHNGYGPNRFVRTALSQEKITLFGNGEEKRDHVNVADLSRLIGLCLMHRSEGILNVATGGSVSFFDVAQTIAELHEDNVDIECLPRQVPIAHRHFDIAAGLEAFPSFRYVPIRNGIADSLKSIADTQNGRD